MDFISVLPAELIFIISDFLPWDSFCLMSGTCRRLRNVLRKRYLWMERPLELWCQEGNFHAVKYVFGFYRYWSQPFHSGLHPRHRFDIRIGRTRIQFQYGQFPVILLEACIRISCLNGNTEIVKYLVDGFPEQRHLIKVGNETIRSTVLSGHIAVADFMLRNFSFSANSFASGFVSDPNCLYEVTLTRNLDMIRYLNGRYAFTKSQIQFGFQTACKISCMEIINYFFTNRFIEKDDIVRGLRIGFKKGHEEVLNLLQGHINDQNVEWVFGHVCDSGPLELVERLVHQTVVTSKSAKYTLWMACRYASRSGHLDILQYLENLRNEQGHKRINIAAYGNAVLVDAFSHSKFHVVHSLLRMSSVRCNQRKRSESFFMYRFVKRAMESYRKCSGSYLSGLEPVLDFINGFIQSQSQLTPRLRRQGTGILNTYKNNVNIIFDSRPS